MFARVEKIANIVFILSSILFLAIAFVGAKIVTNYFVAKEAEKVENVLTNNIALIRSTFEASIFQDAYLADSLATVVAIEPSLAMDNWQDISEKLLSKSNYVRNVAIAPNDVIKMLNPLEGNEKALGLDYRTKPKQWQTILKARALKRVYVAGPLQLVQGGRGLIARYPIFTDYPANEVYWGGVSVVIDIDQLINDTGIEDFNGANIGLRKQFEDGSFGDVFFGDIALFESPDLAYTIRLPSDNWLMVANFDLGELTHIKDIKRVSYTSIGFAVALLYLMLVLHFRHYKLIHKASLFDELTQLPNRRFMIGLLNEITSKAAVRPNFALLNIDLNGFKTINDELGHEAGDELLRHISGLLLENIRASDSAARFGGDEFIVILRDVKDEEGAKLKVEQLRQALESSPMSWQKQQVYPSLSIGFSLYTGHLNSITELLSDADKNMYEQKKSHNEKQSA